MKTTKTSRLIAAFIGGALVSVTLTVTGSSITSVPNQFTSGQVAKASEVNDNFQAVVDEIGSVESRVSAIESSSAGQIQEFSVSPIAYAAGTQFSIFSEQFEIAQLQYFDPVSGFTYQVLYPKLRTLNGVYMRWSVGKESQEPFFAYAKGNASGYSATLSRKIGLVLNTADTLSGEVEVVAYIEIPGSAGLSFYLWPTSTTYSYTSMSNAHHLKYISLNNLSRELLKYVQITRIM
jgi:hypothetical protein